MTLDKAIEVLTSIRQALSDKGEFPDTDALKLGIEALKDIRYLRTTVYPCRPVILPGETED